MSKKEDIMGIFMESPEREYHIREIARLAGVSPMTSRKYLSELNKEGLIRAEKGKVVENYRADMDSQKFRDYKVFRTIRKMRESGLVEYLEDRLNYPAIILFGSASRGMDTGDSDIDLFVVTGSGAEVGLKVFEKRIGRGIQLFTATRGEIKSGEDRELYNNVLNGIVLSGYVEVF